MIFKKADGTEVDLGDVTLDAILDADPALKEAHGKTIKEAIDKRFKAQGGKGKEPPAPPHPPAPAPGPAAIPDDVATELEELRKFRQAAEDAQKSEAQKAQESAIRAVKAEEKRQRDEAARLKAEQDRAAIAESRLDEFHLDQEIIGWLASKNKGIGVKQIPVLVRSAFRKVDGKFVAENPETGALVGVEEYLPAYLKQPGNEPFQPPPLPGSGQQPGGKPGTKIPENLTAGQYMALAIQQRSALAPVNVLPQPGPDNATSPSGQQTGQ
jgi:hypothetical protein